MPTKIITISKPIIVSPEKFTVSFRLVGDTSWTLHGDEDNDPFTLTVPTVGEYEILVEQDECPAFLYGPITILDTPPCECAVVDTANVAIVDIDAVTTVLRIPFIGALPVSPCGWLLVYTNLKTLVTSILTFPTLTNPIDRVIDKGADYSYTLRVNCCSDVYSYCAQGQVSGSSAIPQCQPITLKDVGTVGHVPTSSPSGFYFEVLFKQSIPATLPNINVRYVQLLGGVPGTPDSGIKSLTPLPSGDPTYPWKVVFNVLPNPFVPLVYIVQVEDNACGGGNILWK